MTNSQPSFLRKFFWLIVMPIVWIVASRAISSRGLDRPLVLRAPTPEDVAEAEPPADPDGAWVDYRALYDARQEAELLPAQENGWRDVLRAFGPRALDKDAFCESVAWSELPSDESSKAWFADVWTPLCGKFELDPNEEPVFFERLDLRSYLSKNGIDGKEKLDGNVDASGLSVYWEGRQKKIGRVSDAAIESCLQRLESNPWTKTLFPVAARWIQENADLYDLCEQAVRRPKFGSWRVLNEKLGHIEDTDLSDLKGQREIARLFLARANLRIGQGNLSGAIDDVESILRLARFQLDSNNRFLTDRLTGLSFLEYALSVGIYANPNAQPTPEETERWNSVWREQFAEYDFNAALIRTVDGLRDVFLMTFAQDVCKFQRDSGSVAALFAELTGSEEWTKKAQDEKKRGTQDSALFRARFDDRYLLGTLFTQSNLRAVALETGDKFEFSASDVLETPDAKKRAVESRLAASFFDGTIRPVDSFVEVLQRVACMAQMRTIVNAMLAYEQEHGALPPAYAVDSLGKPTQSWRVLILPYLGEEEKALYEKIRLDEPWDSDANKPFGDVAPPCFRCLSHAHADPGSTPYAVAMGQDALFAYGGVARDLNAMRSRPGVYTNLQALVFERRLPVCWTRPDAELDAHSCRESFGKPDGVLADCHKGGLNVGSASGAVCCRSYRAANEATPSSALIELLLTGR